MFVLLCILGKLYGCQDSESWIICYHTHLKRSLLPWPVSSVVWSIVPMRQGRGFSPWLGHVQESTSKCMDEWNNKSMFLSLFLSRPPLLPLSTLLPFSLSNQWIFLKSDSQRPITKDPFVSLAFLEAELTSNAFHVYLPYLYSFLLTGFLVLLRMWAIDVHPRNLYRCFSLSLLWMATGRLRSC